MGTTTRAAVTPSHTTYVPPRELGGARRSASAPPLTAGRLTDLVKFGAVALELALLVLVFRAWRIESPAFFEILAPLVFAGFVVHHWAPFRLRLAAFALMSVAAVLAVFGPGPGAWLLGLGAGLIALCHVPVRWGLRVALVVAAGAALALLRGGLYERLVGPSPVPAAIWPILGSMFMFRLALYLYELKHEQPEREPRADSRGQPAPLAAGLFRPLAYFFMAPNVAFPLFPVVDYATFKRTYYVEPDRYATYQRGIRWIVRGLVHLLLYRIVYQRLSIAPAEIDSGLDLLRYALANFALYLRVSGQFHLIVGMLHLFGFRLPETHHLFWLSPSFPEFWRRINIYWKDFMTKLVFNPSFFRLRETFPPGSRAPLVLSMLAVFVATWVLHSYQWFWLLGTWLLTPTDAAFWGILALFMVAGLVMQEGERRRRSSQPRVEATTIGPRRRPWRVELRIALKTVGTFFVLCALWSLWSSESFGEWARLWGAAQVDARQAPLLALALVGVALAVGVAAVWASRTVARAELAAPVAATPKRVFSTLAGLALLWGAAQPTVAAVLPVDARAALRDLKMGELNARDAAQLQRGYYENLTGVNRFNGQLWEVYAKRPTSWPRLEDTEAMRTRADFLERELEPVIGIQFHGAPLTTNRWGMRDRDYAEVPPANAVRVAVLGASYVLGSGVGDGETFEALVEERLAAERLAAARAAGAPAVEMLNFALPNYTPPQQLRLLETKVFGFRPDVVLLVSYAGEERITMQRVARFAAAGVELPFDWLRAIVAEAGVTKGMPSDEAIRRLKPYAGRITEESYRGIVEASRARGVRPVWAYLPLPGGAATPAELAAQLAQAERAGFETVNLEDAYAGRDPKTLHVAPWDEHPNAEGHRLVAERLLRELRERPGLFARAR